jgi:ribosome-binding protein aMBF1 (putative translation factor)
MARKSKIVGPSDAQLLAFLKMLESWDGSEPTFQEILVDAASHAAAIQARNKDATAFVPDLAKQTNVAESLIRKWVTGKAPINRKLAKTMVNEIRIYLAWQRVPAAQRPN